MIFHIFDFWYNDENNSGQNSFFFSLGNFSKDSMNSWILIEKLWFAKMICPSKVCSDNFPNEIWHCCALWACKLAATSFNARCKNRTKVGSSRCPSLVWSYNKGRAAKNLGPNVILLFKLPASWNWLFPAHSACAFEFFDPN